MRELIAELPALSVAIPASVLLPLFSVLILWAIFHWTLLPTKNPDQINSSGTDTTGSAQEQHYATEHSEALPTSGTMTAASKSPQAVPPHRARKPDLSNIRSKTPFERGRGNWGFTRKQTSNTAPAASVSGVTADATADAPLTAGSNNNAAATTQEAHSKRSPSAISKQARQNPATESAKRTASSPTELFTNPTAHSTSDRPEPSSTVANPGVAGSIANQQVAAQFAARKDTRTQSQVGTKSNAGADIAEGNNTSDGNVGGTGKADEQAQGETPARHSNLTDQGISKKDHATGEITNLRQNSSSQSAGQHRREAQGGTDQKPATQRSTASIRSLPASTRGAQPESDIDNQTQPAQKKPKYKTAAKTRHIPASIEAQLKLRSPLTSNPTPVANTGGNSSRQSEQKHALLLAEKNRQIEDLQKKLATLEADTQKSTTQRPATQLPDHAQKHAQARVPHPPKAESDSNIRSLHHPHNKTSPSTEKSNPAIQTQLPTEQANQAQNNSALHIAKPLTDQKQHHNDKKQNGLPGSTAENNSAEEDKTTYKRRYQQASEKLTMNERKIDQLRSTVNQLQASGLVELQKAPVTHNNREPLLSKVRVLIKK